ncbi:class II aldolase/adducin family protein [Lentibacillus sp. N15]|uniref:class II aldolase/adducin family protein n=1 Tax=Lentibacillus songyuanensis TaxID=3136161 RepID=UPI0031BB56D0
MPERERLISLGHYLQKNKLAWGTSGNVSTRIDIENMVVTASGTSMGDLKEDDFVVCNINNGEVVGKGKASKETPMHTGVYKRRPDVNVVLHSSPYYTTFAACSSLPIYSDLFVETMYYLEDIAYVDYHHPGSEALGNAVAEASQNANVIILKNHGVVVCDDSIAEVCMRIETLEMACRMCLEAEQAKMALNKISPDKVKEFLEDAVYKPRKSLNGY